MELRDALLPDLMSGKLNIRSDADDRRANEEDT